jgi:hypothetical protein
MISQYEANPLNVHGLRELTWCPPHFTKVRIDTLATKKNFTDWLYENLEGRFFIGEEDIDKHRCTVIAFEIAGEASYFSLMLPEITPDYLRR